MGYITTTTEPNNKIKRFRYNTWIDKIDAYQLVWTIKEFDVLRLLYLVFDFDPYVIPIGRTTNKLSWRIKILTPNEGEENGMTTIKSGELGYLISVRNEIKEGNFNLVARIHTSIFNLDSGKETLLCTDKFCEKHLNYPKTNEYHFQTRKVLFDEALQVEKLLVKVSVDLYSSETKESGYEVSSAVSNI